MKNNANLLPVIFNHEWKQLSRSRSFLWLTALLLLIGVYAIMYGRNEVNDQQKKISLLQNNIDSLYNNMADSLEVKDTLAIRVGEFVGRLHANHPDGLSALSFGQRDIHKFAQHITVGSYFYNKYATGYYNKTQSNEIVNPFKLLSGNLDLGFVFLFLFPLYFILISYNVLSAEKEGGTLGLLRLQPNSITKIIFLKLWLRFFLVTALGLVLFLIAGGINHILFDSRWWWFAAGFITYIFCWMGIIAFVISIKINSGFSALALVSSWIFFAFLLPALLNAFLNVIEPVSTKIELSAAVQKANAEVFAMDKRLRTDSFRKAKPQYANTFDTLGGRDDHRSWRSINLLVDYYIYSFEQKRIAGVTERNYKVAQLNFSSPVLLTQAIFNELAGTNMEQMLAYDTTAYYYFTQLSGFTDSLLFFKENRFTKDDLNEMPVYEFKPVVNYGSISLSLFVLLSIGGLLIVISSIQLFPKSHNKFLNNN